jgi:hypothetical protein
MVVRLAEEGLRMKGLIIVVVVLVAIVVGVGFYREWFHISTGGGTDGTERPGITVDPAKIKADEEKAKEAAQDLEHKVKEKSTAATDKGKGETQRP